jgi:hypothetical protein
MWNPPRVVGRRLRPNRRDTGNVVTVVVERHTERRILDRPYAAGLRARPALLVRGSSRRITIMRFRPANIRVINRRNSRLDHHRRRVLLQVTTRKTALMNNTLMRPTS